MTIPDDIFADIVNKKMDSKQNVAKVACHVISYLVDALKYGRGSTALELKSFRTAHDALKRVAFGDDCHKCVPGCKCKSGFPPDEQCPDCKEDSPRSSYCVCPPPEEKA